MEPRVVRPSAKIAIVWYVIAAGVLAGAAYAYYTYMPDKPQWLLAIPALLFLIPISKHIKTRLVTLTIAGDRLTLERGLFSKYTRTVDLVKVQDVTVRQTMRERILGIGDLSLETAGESGMVAMDGIDRPREVAELILAAAKKPMRGPNAASAL